MITDDDYSALVSHMEALLTELDRLKLPLVAVHVDFALRRLEVIAGIASNDESAQN